MYPKQQGKILKEKGTKDNKVFIVITLQKKNTFCSLQKMCEGQFCVFLFLKKRMLHELQCNQYLFFFVCFFSALVLKKGIFFFFKVQHSQVCGHKRAAVFGKKSGPWSSLSPAAHLALSHEVDVVGAV